jgi:hypothetical protein
MTVLCEECGQPVGPEAHHGHQPDCDRTRDCWCDVLYCPDCCTECTPSPATEATP